MAPLSVETSTRSTPDRASSAVPETVMGVSVTVALAVGEPMVQTGAVRSSPKTKWTGPEDQSDHRPLLSRAATCQ